jgi:CDP-4-dehydro-6-deoxyglucose reductase/terephthalate 1,2-dioxygenase reductase component
VELPYGSFGLAATEAPILCIVGGTGFAPVKSILDDMVKKGNKRPVTLVWGGRDKDGLYLLSRVEAWKKSLPGFTFVPALEDAAQASELGGFHGRVDDAVRSLAADLASHEVYCCGSPAMVTAVKKTCEERGIAADRFFRDVFVPGPAA